MKRAKKRIHPLLARLKASTLRADRALSDALRGVEKYQHNQRRHKYALATLIAELDSSGFPVMKDWDEMPAVGREIG